ncbi:PREDICTED: U3 small nucleolar ribonucleoprotein protein MPP10 isoform X1 [Camelina sativa]|uniref:U3 small nucleolar ribonucleoprotein protein MPP10 isoform X1 n=1 Tax=Camelina sativa TaxID=90675 RepID=A0ABM0W3W9_CAMSA|nr:PREDICTED: U3 small nucleolar ribonucleoprotein protein MPP10 isoform X1 [Camelina sativa]
MAIVKDSGFEALEKLKSTEPPVFLAPSSKSEEARAASQHLFEKLKPYNPKSPFDELLVDGFDAEQIWQQIDMQSQPLLSSLRQEVNRFAKNPEEIRKLGNLTLKVSQKDDVDEMDMDGSESGDDELEANESEGEEEEDEEDEDEDGDEDEEEKNGDNEGIEDEFFKIKELEEFLEDGEAEEYGIDYKNKKGVAKKKKQNLRDDDDEEDDEEDEDDEFGAFAGGDDEEADKLGKAKYTDFFGGKKKETKVKWKDLSEDEAEFENDQGDVKLSTHEKERVKLQSKIEQMEKANLDPKHWTMQGEITAAKRPKNSALEVDLDFEHNARPAPVITEEVTASLEDLIKSRIIEARFDDVQRAPSMPTKAKREAKEMDESKSKKGLAEVYEDEYVRTANPAFAPTTFSDELKKEASMLFKNLCLKLDALSHFHFTPKPVIEEMSIQTNVPAIAMEEVAPVAVSDATMLAPEEIFSGKGDIKDESELTQEERKRRRAKKKRKFKAESAKEPVKKARDATTVAGSEGL